MGQNRDLSKFPNAITVLDNGSVGIGNTNPQTSLDIKKGSEFLRSTASAVNEPQYQTWYDSTGNRRGFLGYGSGGDDSLFIYNETTTGNIYFGANGRKMTITSAGNVGIGTDSPRGVFDVRVATDRGVAITGTLSTQSVISGIQGNVSANLRELRIAGSTLFFNTGDGTNSTGTERMRITEAGKVGIGTTNPTYPLTVDATNSDLITFKNGGIEVGRFGIDGATTNGWMALYSSSSVKVQITAGSVATFFAGSGNFGVGTDAPQGKFHVDHGDAYHMGIQHNKTGTYVTETKFGRPSTSSNVSLIYDIAGTEIAEFRRNYSAAKMIFTKETTTHMEISSSGVVTIPLQPAFSMGVSSNVTGPSVVAAGRLIFNDGGYYNTSTYRFTAPVAGRYLFTFYDNIFPNDTAPAQFYFRVNGTRRGAIAYTLNKGTSWYLISFQQVIKLNSGDYVDVYNQSNDRPDYGSDDGWGNFSGFLIG